MEACGISSKIFLSHKKRAAQIKLLPRDVDGTVTDGGLILLSQTETRRSKLKPSTRTRDRAYWVSHWLTSLGFAWGCIT
jgi:hypothetical protein